jgi:hypothetical protein
MFIHSRAKKLLYNRCTFDCGLVDGISYYRNQFGGLGPSDLLDKKKIMKAKNLYASSHARTRPFAGDHGRIVTDEAEIDGGSLSGRSGWCD